jgi:hypothetical protein
MTAVEIYAIALSEYLRSEPKVAEFIGYDMAQGNTAKFTMKGHEGDSPLAMDLATQQRFSAWLGQQDRRLRIVGDASDAPGD